MPDLPRVFSYSGNRFRAFDSRPVSCQCSQALSRSKGDEICFVPTTFTPRPWKLRVPFSLAANPEQRAIGTTTNLARGGTITTQTLNMFGATSVRYSRFLWRHRQRSPAELPIGCARNPKWRSHAAY